MKPDDIFILNRKNANQNIIFCYTWRFIYCLIKHIQAYFYAVMMFSLVLLLVLLLVLILMLILQVLLQHSGIV